MIRSYKFPLKPNKAQEASLQTILVACQRLYNGALEERREAYRRQRVTVSKYEQFKELTELRGQDQAYGVIAARILRSPLDRLDKAYKAFFRRCKTGEKPGFPRFKSRDRYKSFSWANPSVKRNRVLVPNLGWIKLNLYRFIPEGAKPVQAHINRLPSGWEIGFVCDVGPAPTKIVDINKTVGLDLGLKSFLVLSDGKSVDNPRFFRRGQDILARRQQSLARKVKWSKSRGRQKVLVGKAHRHVKNQRLDFARKLVNDLVTRYDVICHEDLNIRGMVHGNLSKSVYDASWGLFIHCLATKAEEAGKLVIGVNPRGTSQGCSQCGATVPKARRDSAIGYMIAPRVACLSTGITTLPSTLKRSV